MIIAHRGESYDAPENTLASILLAWNRGAQAVEVDVHLSKDNEVIVIHDFNTKRVAGLDKAIKDQTLNELKQLDVGSWKGDQWSGERVPTLPEVLEAMPQGSKLIIEIKSDESIIPFLKKDLKKSGLNAGQIEFIGFDLNTITRVKMEFPDQEVLWLLDLDYDWTKRLPRPSLKQMIFKTKRHSMSGLNVWAGKMLDEAFVHQVHDSGLLLYCWTVNDIGKARELTRWGIDAITTDRAQWLKSRLKM